MTACSHSPTSGPSASRAEGRREAHRALAVEKGASAADAWLRAIRMVRADLEDETRLVPLPSLHRALVALRDVGASS